MDLFKFWRLEERYAKAGYKWKNIWIGIGLMEKIDVYAFDWIHYGVGIYRFKIQGVICYMLKHEDMVFIGLFNDFNEAGQKIIQERL